MTDFRSSVSETLLPCPFCAGPVDFYENRIDHQTVWSVSCSDCGVYLDACEDTKAAAAQRWNTRGLAQRAPDRQAIAIMIREYLQKKYGTAAVRMSDGMERIYYSGVSLLDIADALSNTSTTGNSK